MKLAIHNGKDKKTSWNLRWMEYCEEKGIPYIGVNCHSSDIIQILRKENVTHLMWAFSLSLPKDLIMAQSVLNAVEKMGIKTFPNFPNRYHFEDKIAQKYILEAIDAPIVDSWVFYDKQEASNFVQTYKEPLVAKLRRGAGSFNVVLLPTPKKAKQYISKMFTRGVNPAPSLSDFGREKIKKVRNHIHTNLALLDLFQKAMIHLKRRSLYPKEMGYVYFQKFLKDNKNDLRIAVVGNRIWGFYRGVRSGDFRASGSGIIDYVTEIPLDIVKTSWKITQTLGTQSLCFDYVKDADGSYKIVEICYGYVGEAIYKCNGYWDENFQFHEGHFYPEFLILEDFIK